MAKFMTIRIWILLIFLFFAILAINPSPLAKGVQVKHIAEYSVLKTEGMETGEKILSINHNQIETLTDFKNEINKLEPKTKEISIKTSKEEIKHTITTSLGFKIDENLTIIDVSPQTLLSKDATLLQIENTKISSLEDFKQIEQKLIPKTKVIIKTNAKEYALLSSGDLGITVEKAKTSNVNKGLELQGGTRVLLKPISDEKITQQQIQNLILVLNNRLNIYGLSEVIIRPAKDLEGIHYVVVEIAGATRDEVRELISQQGVFEAKIGNEIVFEGGKKDIPFVCKDDGSCAGIIPPCSQVSQDYYSCKFQFAITLSQSAAKNHAEITKNIPVNASSPQGEYLEKQLDLYLDSKLVDSLLISEDLKGRETTQIAISGPGFGETEEAAYYDAVNNMEKLQTILITGSLPLQIEIVKLDTISPTFGKEFIKNAFLVGFLAIVSVAIIVFLRYRKFKIVIPMMITSISEIIIILGIAALIKWNLDLAAIAGIIAAVGTGVDHQIVIADEVFKKRTRQLSWKEKIKRAFFIIMAAYGTTVAAMLPLWNAGAGLLRGFALTTIIGVSIGVFVTRPAFASMIEKLVE